MNPIFAIFKFFYNDLKEDIVTVWKIFTVKGYFEKGLDRIAQGLRMFNINDFLSTTWPIIIIIIAFFFAGWFLASHYYANVCNEHIYNTFYAPKLMNLTSQYLLNRNLIQ